MHEYNIEELKELASIYTKCQAEGINPALVNKRYTMVMGKPTLPTLPTLKADTLLADLIANKGRITWLELTYRQPYRGGLVYTAGWNSRQAHLEIFLKEIINARIQY